MCEWEDDFKTQANRACDIRKSASVSRVRAIGELR